MTYAPQLSDLFDQLGVRLPAAGTLQVRTPIDGSVIASLAPTSALDVTKTIDRAHERFLGWRSIPAPQRGALIRAFGEKVRTHKQMLGRIVSIETGKIPSEALG
jgi:aldehyde dehydrogenase (NAD+)